MPVYHDTSESTRALPDSRSLDWLEERTGADFLITPLAIPVTPGLLARHTEAGALLVQVKVGLDLAASVGLRMKESLSRMLVAAPRPCQRVLLAVGVLTCNVVGEGEIDGRPLPAQVTWEGVEAALSWWRLRGGVTAGISRKGLFPAWCEAREREVRHVLANPAEVFYAGLDAEVMLQELKRVRDWRVTMATFPGLGPGRVEALAETLIEHGKANGAEGMTAGDVALLDALRWATDEELPRPRGWGKGQQARNRVWLGLEPGSGLNLTVAYTGVDSPKERENGEQGNE